VTSPSPTFIWNRTKLRRRLAGFVVRSRGLCDLMASVIAEKDVFVVLKLIDSSTRLAMAFSTYC